MAAVLASNSCYCCNMELINQARTIDNLSFSSSISTQFPSKFKRHKHYQPKTDKFYRSQVQMQQTDSPMKLGTNGRPRGRQIKMVPTSEVMRRKSASIQKGEIVNGSKRVVNGASLVKREASPPLVKSPKTRESKEFPSSEDLKVLPSDESFSWASENYNSVQRSIDVWSFVLSLRVRVLLDNAKWAYLGGFTEEKQVSFDNAKCTNCMSQLLLCISLLVFDSLHFFFFVTIWIAFIFCMF